MSSKAIAAIRRLVDAYTTRDQLKQLLLEAGANSERILRIRVSGNMKSPGYQSKSDIMNEGFDTIYQDFEKADADGILFELVRIIFAQRRVAEQVRVDLEQVLAASGVELSQLIDLGAGQDLMHAAIELSDTASLREAHDLLRKALSRITTDPSGAITAAVSAAESVCREAISRLHIPEPRSKQLPNYLVLLRRRSNIEDLAQIGNSEAHVIQSLSSLAENSYHAAHETGDRHAHGDNAVPPSPLLIDMLVVSACAITVVLAGVLLRNELELKS